MVNSAFVNLLEKIRRKGKVCRRANIFQKKKLSKMDAGKNCVHRWTVQILSMLDSKHFRLNSANKVLALPSPMNLTNCTGRRTNFWLNKVTANNCLQNVPGMVTEINYHRCSPTAAYEFSSRRAKRFQKDGPGNSTRTRKSRRYKSKNYPNYSLLVKTESDLVARDDMPRGW